MDDTEETGEFRRVLKLELGAVPRYFARFSHAHLKFNLISIIWILHLCFHLVCAQIYIFKYGTAANVSMSTGPSLLSEF